MNRKWESIQHIGEVGTGSHSKISVAAGYSDDIPYIVLQTHYKHRLYKTWRIGEESISIPLVAVTDSVVYPYKEIDNLVEVALEVLTVMPRLHSTDDGLLTQEEIEHILELIEHMERELHETE